MMQHLLSDADWAFMTCSSPPFLDEKHYAKQTEQHVPTFRDSSHFEHLYCNNYMTVLRER